MRSALFCLHNGGGMGIGWENKGGTGMVRGFEQAAAVLPAELAECAAGLTEQEREIMKTHSLFTADNLAVLQNKEKCIELFKHYSMNGILMKISNSEGIESQRKDSSGHPRYYAEKYTVEGEDFLVSSEWRPDRDEARKNIINWVFSMIQEVNYATGYQSKFARNRILFGAPGTGNRRTAGASF